MAPPDATSAAASAPLLEPRWRSRLRRSLQPVDVRVERTLSSNLDATAVDPTLGLQLGFGGIGAFRAPSGRNATSAGAVTRLVVTNTIGFPFGLSLTNRMEAGGTNSWWRRTTTDRQAEAMGVQRTLPDLSLRWSWRPAFARELVENVGANARMLWNSQRSDAPSDEGSPADTRATIVRSYPLNGTIAWKAFGGFTTAGGVSRALRYDDVPGSRTEQRQREANVEIAKAFRTPARWRLRTPIRARAGWQAVENETMLRPRDLLDGPARDDALRVVQADNGRRALSFSASSDVAETLNLSLNGSHVTTFNNNLNQRLTQTVFSAVLNLSFGAAQLR